MAKKSIDELIGQVLTDQTFRAKLLANPEGTLSEAGYELEPEALDAIKKVKPEDIDAMAKDFEQKFASRKAAM
jgi:hypothetical protein